MKKLYAIGYDAHMPLAVSIGSSNRTKAPYIYINLGYEF